MTYYAGNLIYLGSQKETPESFIYIYYIYNIYIYIENLYIKNL